MDSKRNHILIVDDDQELAEMISDYLRLAGPFEVNTALNVDALWQCLLGDQYDVILLDYHLPDGDGLSVLSELPRCNYSIPVVMLTGQGDEHIAAQAIQRGAVEYLVKDGSYDFLRKLPAVIHKAIQVQQLKFVIEQSLEKIHYQAFLLDNVQDAIVVWDAQGKITFWNFAAQRTFGWSAEERLGQPADSCYFSIFEPAITLPLTGAAIQDHFQSKEIERRCRTKSGEQIWVSSSITLLDSKNSPGMIDGYMDISRDITRRKQIESQMQAAQQRLAESRRLASIGELASGVAHQINNPLTTILADVQILLNNLPADHPARESAEAIQQAGWRTREVVQRLMEFSQPPSDTLEMVALNQTIDNALLLVGASIRSAGISLEINLAEPSPSIYGNRQRLEDLWVNLLLLARDAIRQGQGSTITLRSAIPDERSVIITVHDDGAIIPAEQLKTIFEPHFMTLPGGRGSGIELSLCQEIVRQHQGTILALSESGKGTTFQVQFPLKLPST